MEIETDNKKSVKGRIVTAALLNCQEHPKDRSIIILIPKMNC